MVWQRYIANIKFEVYRHQKVTLLLCIFRCGHLKQDGRFLRPGMKSKKRREQKN